MDMIRPILLAGAVVALPSLAAAQGLQFDGTVTVGANFNNINIDGAGPPFDDISLNGYSLDFDGDIHFDENFSVGIGAAINSGDLSIDTTDLNIDLMSFYVEPTYNLGNGGYVGAYVRMYDLDVSPGGIAIGADLTNYGIFGGYDFGQGHVEVFYGMTELDDPNDVIGDNLDITDFGISGSYQAMPELDIFGAFYYTNISAGGTDIPISAFSVGAEYDLGNGIGLYGAAGLLNLDLSDAIPTAEDIQATNLTLGASYDLSMQGSLPLVLSAEYSRTNIDLANGITIEPTIDRFALGVTIPIGNGSTTALNSNTRSARGDYRSALEAVLNSF
ncbi:outer membrane beta-barrel protein [Rhodobacterales bacterium HKCCE4037]|nr:outer membrane beta-barrel protein [Rhodobacterales bacterium HKCCE4037]